MLMMMPKTCQMIQNICESKEHRAECPDHSKCGLVSALETLANLAVKEAGNKPPCDRRREEFAKAAMQGILSMRELLPGDNLGHVASVAIQVADAVIEALNKPKEEPTPHDHRI